MLPIPTIAPTVLDQPSNTDKIPGPTPFFLASPRRPRVLCRIAANFLNWKPLDRIVAIAPAPRNMRGRYGFHIIS